MTSESPQKRAPRSLSKPQQALWRDVTAKFELSAGEYRILEDALVLCDRADAAAKAVATDGVVVPDRYGTPKAHAAVDLEVRCRTSAARLFKQLGVELDDDSPTISRREADRRGKSV